MYVRVLAELKLLHRAKLYIYILKCLWLLQAALLVKVTK